MSKKQANRWITHNRSGKHVVMHCPICGVAIRENTMNADCPNPDCEGGGFKTLRRRRKADEREEEGIAELFEFDPGTLEGSYL